MIKAVLAANAENMITRRKTDRLVGSSRML